jgi:hypothetical protein
VFALWCDADILSASTQHGRLAGHERLLAGMSAPLPSSFYSICSTPVSDVQQMEYGHGGVLPYGCQLTWLAIVSIMMVVTVIIVVMILIRHVIVICTSTDSTVIVPG